MSKSYKPNVITFIFAMFFIFSINTNSYGFDLNKLLKNLPQQNDGKTISEQTNSGDKISPNPFSEIFGRSPTSSPTGNNNPNPGKSKKFDLGHTFCSALKEKRHGVLYSSLPGSELEADQRYVASDFNMELNDTKRFLQDEFINTKSAAWVNHPKADYISSFLNKKVKETLIDFYEKPELRLEMAARIRKAANDPSMKKSAKADAEFAYALILARFEQFHGNSSLIETHLTQSFKSGNVGASYVKALRMYNGYGVEKNVNAAANFSVLAVSRVEEANQEANRLGTTRLNWKAPSDLKLLNLTNPEYKGHERYRNMAAQGDAMRKYYEAQYNSNSNPAALEVAERFTMAFDDAMSELAEILGIGGQVAAERLKFQTANARLDDKQQILETRIAYSKSTAEFIKEAIDKSDSGLRQDVVQKAKELRSRVNALAADALFRTLRIFSLTTVSKDTARAYHELDGVKKGGCGLVLAMDDYLARSNVAFTDEEKKKLGDSAMSQLEAEIPEDTGK